MQVCRSQRAFSLTEMVITVTVLAILAAIAAPSFQETIQKRRVIGAAEELAANLQYARTEAIKGNRSVGVNFTADGTDTWCYGMVAPAAAACVCNTDAASNCTVDTVLKVFNSDGYRGVSMTAPAFGGAGRTGFEERRGFLTAGGGGTVRFSSASQELNVVLSVQGRVRLCSPGSPPLSGYPAC